MKENLLLSSQLSVRPQFARSVQLERDAGSSVVDAYMPTARALDLLGRIAVAMDDQTAGRAWSVVGPYGSGKSSFALYLDALFGPKDAPGRSHAVRELQAVSPVIADRLETLRKHAGVDATGYVRMFATARREPVSLTLLRAIESGLARHGILAGRSTAARRLSHALSALKSTSAVPDAGSILELVRGASAFAPVLLVIDEYGKNVEYLVDDTRDGDLFIVQELAEEAAGLSRTPLSVITMQHLSLEDYLAASPTAQLREWGKVRGRFEDVAFVDSPQQVQRLVAKVFDTSSASADLRAAIGVWGDAEALAASRLGVRGFVNAPGNLAACYPLHPSSLMVLPELCASYGQNERTLFSFLAGSEALSVPDFMARTPVTSTLATVRLFDVYDYFLGNPATITISAANASRWFEISTRVSETKSIDEPDLRCLKTVGVLNLISQGGALRASQAIVSWALSGSEGFADDDAVRAALERLCAAGALTYRAFADEYRVWQGSDFDFVAAIGRARDRLASRSRAEILERALPLEPAVAARHSQQTGSLRYFGRHFVDRSTLERVLAAAAEGDGLVLYPVEDLEMGDVPLGRPMLVARSDDLVLLSELALETAALVEVSEEDDAVGGDWVARRELRERSAMARDALASEFYLLAQQLSYRCYGLEGTTPGKELEGNLSALLSHVCDEIYCSTPIVRNEVLNRRELTSQGAKARRDLLEAIVDHPTEAQLGIEGYGPERAIYEAVIRAPGIHVQIDAKWRIGEPSKESDFRPAWEGLDEILGRAATAPVSLDVLDTRLGAPPYGMLAGPTPVLLTAWLLCHADDVALFQDGSFQPRLSIEVIERLIKAPSRFSIRFVGVAGARKRVLDRLSQTIEPRHLGPDVRNATVLQVLAPLVSLAHSLSPFARTTRELVSEQTAAIRDCLLTAREPGELLFEALPRACGMKALTARASSDEGVDAFVKAVNEAVAELQDADARLLRTIRQQLAARLRLSQEELRPMLAARASVLASRTLIPSVRSFMITASDQGLDEQDWLEAIAMNIASRPPRSWTDENVARFEALLGEMVEAFRRVEHLYHEALDGPHDGFEVARITRTESDGSEQGEVLWVETSHKAILARIIEEARAMAVAALGPRAESALLAVHAEALLKPKGETQSQVLGDAISRVEAHGG